MKKTLVEKIKKVAEITNAFCSFECSLSKIEAVPAKFPRMIWITLNENVALSEIYGRLKKALMLENEHSDFKAHITAARIRAGQQANKIIGITKNEIEPLKFRISELKMMKSILKSDSPEYIVIKSIALANVREHA